jgi:hypothetical protein
MSITYIGYIFVKYDVHWYMDVQFDYSLTQCNFLISVICLIICAQVVKSSCRFGRYERQCQGLQRFTVCSCTSEVSIVRVRRHI